MSSGESQFSTEEEGDHTYDDASGASKDEEPKSFSKKYRTHDAQKRRERRGAVFEKEGEILDSIPRDPAIEKLEHKINTNKHIITKKENVLKEVQEQANKRRNSSKNDFSNMFAKSGNFSSVDDAHKTDMFKQRRRKIISPYMDFVTAGLTATPDLETHIYNEKYEKGKHNIKQIARYLNGILGPIAAGILINELMKRRKRDEEETDSSTSALSPSSPEQSPYPTAKTETSPVVPPIQSSSLTKEENASISTSIPSATSDSSNVDLQSMKSGMQTLKSKVDIQGAQLKTQGEQLKTQTAQLKTQGEQLKTQTAQLTKILQLLQISTTRSKTSPTSSPIASPGKATI
jgi:hypothetical protein